MKNLFKYFKKEKRSSTFGMANKQNRNEWLKLQLSQIPNNYRILDAGAGELQYKGFCSHLNYVSQDFGKYEGIGNSKGLQTGMWEQSKIDIISDITNIPESNSSFDVIMCIEVFEHIPEPIKAIAEFARLLKKDGILLITAPFCSLTHFAPYHFYTGFNSYFFEKFLQENGFKVAEISPNGNYFEYIAQELQFRIPNHYTKKTLTTNEKKLIKDVIIILEEMSKTDTQSNELLCFGYHVKATKL